MLGTWKVGTLYVADGSVNIGKVIKNIADKIDDDILKGYLKEKGTDASSVVSAKYSYVVSASVVNVRTLRFAEEPVCQLCSGYYYPYWCN